MFVLQSLMSLGDGMEDSGEERHAQAGQDATLAGLQLVELWGLALDLLQAFMTGIAVQTLREEPQAHILAHQHGLRAQECAQDHQELL